MRTIEEIALSHNPRGEVLLDDETVILTPSQYRELLVYNSTLPTGQTIGKRWRRHGEMGEYVTHDDPRYMGIKWRRIIVVE